MILRTSTSKGSDTRGMRVCKRTFVRASAFSRKEHDMTCIQYTVLALPWILLTLCAVFLALGLSWRQITDADTVNGAFLIVALVLGALALCTLCVRELDPLREEEKKKPQPVQQAPPENARLPLVTV